MKRAAVLSMMLSGACRPAVDAPERVEEQVVFAFVNFDEPGHVEAVADAILAFAERDDEQLDEGYAVDILDGEHLEAVGVATPVLNGIVGALGRAIYRHDAHGVAHASTDADRETWWPGVEQYDVVDEVGDRDCFLARDCERYALTIEEVTKAPVLGRTERTLTNEARWILTDAGAEVLAVRQLAPEPVVTASPLFAIDQQYSMTLVADTPDGARRAEAIWVDARVLGAELPEGFAVRQVVSAMQRAADHVDAFLDEVSR